MSRPAKFDEIAEQLQHRIESGAYGTGQPLPTEVALAKEFKVHRMTLRKALDVLERGQLVIRQHGRGTFSNMPTRANRLTTVLYIGETNEHFYDSFYRALCAEAQDRRQVVSAFLPNTAEKARQLGELAMQSDQIVCHDECWEAAKGLLGEGKHVVRVSGFHGVDEVEPDGLPHYVVSTDRFRAIGLAVDHLVQLGHRRIALLGASFGAADQAVMGDMDSFGLPLVSYRSALARHSLGYEAALGTPDQLEVPWQDWHERCLQHYLQSCKTLPTAFVCDGDFRAVPLLRALRKRGLRVPEDISVVGIGNTPWAEMLEVPLTSVCLGEAEMARLAMLLNADPVPELSRGFRVVPHVVVRQSTVPPAGEPGA